MKLNKPFIVFILLLLPFFTLAQVMPVSFFSSTTISPSSGGNAIVSAYSCATATSGTLTAGTAVSGVTQTITATVTTNGGTYNINTATTNGVSFAGLGTFAGSGSQNIVLTATGTPTYGGGSTTFILTTTPNCGGFSRPVTFVQSVVEVTSASGKIWMDRNLGATQAAISRNDASGYGDMYQWGRLTDGHQFRGSTKSALNATSSVDVPGNSNFILTNSGLDWRSPRNDNLWQGVNGVNNPCPSGFRLPTQTELDAEIAIFATQDHDGAFGSVLKLVLAGTRSETDGILGSRGSTGIYWSSTVSGNNSIRLLFNSVSASASTNQNRAQAGSVRCIKN